MMTTAVSVLLCAVFIAMASRYAFEALQTGSLAVHHLRWLALSVLMLTALPSLTWDRSVFAALFAGYGVPDPDRWAHCAAWGCTAAAAAAVLHRRIMERLFRAVQGRELQCS